MEASKEFIDRFEFRTINDDEIEQAIDIEKTCFPPNEACSAQNMRARIAKAQDIFLVALDKETGRLAGFLNGIATDETVFRDEFFTEADNHKDDGANIMICGLDVLPDYQMKGLGRELMHRYQIREKDRGRKSLVLTCLDSKVGMYKKFGFTDNGVCDSTWGGEQWHEMVCEFTK
ncbi:MAG: GNAT family N-acetyltransferase [Butyrivibrio sp.]|uniref:GNAT family N-acetyltransferase n=1 Tax=Butyrivibrio sp. TaxID=28121 RepID=UPI0025D132C7|nr:GNAT family N-acetyltransferase [Butyrivibrio sp.]MCR5770449.1 GNAT family N-acetyltransferase [Butyrivibrio sp.]